MGFLDNLNWNELAQTENEKLLKETIKRRDSLIQSIEMNQSSLLDQRYKIWADMGELLSNHLKQPDEQEVFDQQASDYLAKVNELEKEIETANHKIDELNKRYDEEIQLLENLIQQESNITPAAPYQESEGDQSSDRPRFCTNCGNKLNSSGQFCSECGTKI